jgi:hypothetical protein
VNGKAFIVLQFNLFMNQAQQLTGQLNELKNIIEDAKAILEWHKLRISETNRNPSSRVFFQDDAFQQLTDKRAAFQSLWIQITLLLQDKTIPLSQNQRIEFQKELRTLSLQFYYIGTDVRIY